MLAKIWNYNKWITVTDDNRLASVFDAADPHRAGDHFQLRRLSRPADGVHGLQARQRL